MSDVTETFNNVASALEDGINKWITTKVMNVLLTCDGRIFITNVLVGYVGEIGEILSEFLRRDMRQFRPS